MKCGLPTINCREKIYINGRAGVRADACDNVTQCKTRQRAVSIAVVLGCGSCFHTELSNLFVLPGWELRDKEGKCKCKTSHDRIWQETEISSLPLWCSLLHSLNHFNLPLNTIPSRLNFDHCHFAKLQDWKDWDKCIIHSTHQFGPPLLPVMHFSHVPVTFVFCSVCSVVGRRRSLGIWNGRRRLERKCHRLTEIYITKNVNK